MFGRKQNHQEIIEVIAPVIKVAEKVPTTLEVLKKLINTPQPLKSHLDKIHKLRDQESRCFSVQDRAKLKENGFRIFITSGWIGKFLYHANIYTPKRTYEAVHVQYNDSGENLWNIGGSVDYAGDIPDEVIEKALKAKPLVCQISVHSMMPFPIEFVRCDPIMIGWARTPEIQLLPNGIFEKTWVDNAEGVVIAIWDYEKEVDLLGSLF